jgi:hypothetical protein
MKKFLVKSVFSILLLVIVLLLGDAFINNFLSNNSFYKINSSSNILIFGHSHSSCALNDSLIDHSINFSEGAEPYFYTYYKLRKLIEANPNIHVLILEYTNNVFSAETDKWVYGKRCLINQYPKYSQLISIKDKWFICRKNPRPYLIAFRDALKAKTRLLFKRNVLVYNTLRWREDLLNMQKMKEFPKSNLKTSNSNANIESSSTLNILYLKMIVNYCRVNNIKLILFRSPLHQFYMRDFETELANLLRSDFSNIPFWDYSNYPLKDYEFLNLSHVNYKGAERFSKVINLRLNQDYKSMRAE